MQQNLLSACCIAAGQLHEQCNCKANVDFCKKACDYDNQCKGYVAFGNSYCQLATTSTCPATNECKKYAIGKTGNLDANAACGSLFKGCFIKQWGQYVCILWH